VVWLNISASIPGSTPTCGSAPALGHRALLRITPAASACSKRHTSPTGDEESGGAPLFVFQHVVQLIHLVVRYADKLREQQAPVQGGTPAQQEVGGAVFLSASVLLCDIGSDGFGRLNCVVEAAALSIAMWFSSAT
jgi:hypothetical protein